MAISGSGWDMISPWDAVRATGGSNGLDARGTNAKSVKDCALSRRSKVGRTRVRSTQPAGLYHGAPEAHNPDAAIVRPQSKNARRKAARYGR